MTVEQSQQPSPILTISFSEENGGKLALLNNEEAYLWLKDEVSFWSWLEKIDGIKDGNLVRHVNGVTQTYLTMKKILSDSSEDSSLIDISDLHDCLVQWRDGQKMPLSDSTKAKAMNYVFESLGPWAAYSVVGYVTERYFQLQFPTAFAGILRYHMLLDGITVESTKMLVQAYESSREKSNKRFLELNRKAAGLVSELSDFKDNSEKAREVLKRWANSRWKVFKEGGAKEIKKEIDSLHEVKKTYTEYMNLSAPVAYWQGKSEEHFNSAETRRDILIGYTILAPLAYVGSVYGMWDHITDFDKNSYLPIGILAFIITIIFWVGRVFVRLYLSELHLGIDAKERAVMVQTYLALLNENKVEKSDREMVLTALFRPTTDGIVKDDAAPAFMPSSYLSGRMAG